METNEKKFEKQKEEIKEVNPSKKLNFIQKNPQTTGALILGIIAILIMFIPSGGFVSIILVIFAARRLLKAKKLNENKTYRYISYPVVYIPVIVWIVYSVVYAFFVLE